MENQRAVKCQYCENEKLIDKPAQTTFSCCKKIKVIGKLTLLLEEAKKVQPEATKEEIKSKASNKVSENRQYNKLK